MADDAKPKRPFWKTRRFMGGLLGASAAVLATVPAAPLFALGAVVINTQAASIALGFLGTYVFGYGQGRATEREVAK